MQNMQICRICKYAEYVEHAKYAKKIYTNMQKKANMQNMQTPGVEFDQGYLSFLSSDMSCFGV